MDHCAQCGFAYHDVSRDAVASRLRTLPGRYRETLTAMPSPRRRPRPEVWSPLEYTCHVRDVFGVQRERLALACTQDEPEFAPMDRESRVEAHRYNEQDITVVLAELTDAARELAGSFSALTADQWSRTAVYNWPRREVRTMEWLGRHTVHEGEHHLQDLTIPAEGA